MKLYGAILISVFLIKVVAAQEFEVREFRADPTDIAARMSDCRTENDEPCAIVKVVTKGITPPQDLIRITFRMNEENGYIRSGENAPVLSPGSNAVFNLPKGQHSFRFIKDGFKEMQQTIDVQEEQIIFITLEPGDPTTTLSLPGWIIITSEPQGAEVYLNEQRVGTTPYQGRQIAGQYSLMLSYPLYHEHYEQFILGEGATVSLPAITMKPRFGYWQVRSTPEGAEVRLDGWFIGTTPLLRKQIGSGIHELSVSMPLYHEHKENFNIEDGDDKSFDIKLKEAFGHLIVTSDPSGAGVHIDGRHVGTTPYENKQQLSGRYNIRLTRELYSDANEQVTVRDGERTERFIPLGRNFGVLEVNAEGADIYLDDQRVGTGNWSSNLPPGQYKIKATRTLHNDDEREVFIVVGQRETITLAPRPRQGALSVVSRPFETRGAEIWINGEKRLETTPAVIPLLTGNYNVTIRKTGYLDASQTVEILEGRERELAFEMQTFEGSLLEKFRRQRTAKIIYGTAMVAAAVTGAYFQYSSMTLAEDYKTATSGADEIYDNMERHGLISYISFGAAVPLGIMTIVKSVQQRRTAREFNIAATPVREGVLFSLVYRF